MSEEIKNMKKIADKILCGVDYDIYKEDCNEMENLLRDEIELTLQNEFGLFCEMYNFLNDLANGRGVPYPIEELLSKIEGGGDE